VIRRFLEKHQVAHCFWQIAGIDQPGNKREKIQAIRQTVSLSLPTVMIGDAVSDIQAAREAGAVSIAVSWGHQDRNKLLEAQPDFIADHPRDILTFIRTNLTLRSG
jgi:phosphoglycolate phosphatase-like HAD superfamily hydrolase